MVRLGHFLRGVQRADRQTYRYAVRVEVYGPDGHLILGSTTEGKLPLPNLRNADDMVQAAMKQASVDHRELT